MRINYREFLQAVDRVDSAVARLAAVTQDRSIDVNTRRLIREVIDRDLADACVKFQYVQDTATP